MALDTAATLLSPLTATTTWCPNRPASCQTVRMTDGPPPGPPWQTPGSWTAQQPPGPGTTPPRGGDPRWAVLLFAVVVVCAVIGLTVLFVATRPSDQVATTDSSTTSQPSTTTTTSRS